MTKFRRSLRSLTADFFSQQASRLLPRLFPTEGRDRRPGRSGPSRVSRPVARRLQAESLEARALMAADVNAVFDGGFETAFHFYGITVGNQDDNPSLLIDPAGNNTGWYLQPIPWLNNQGSVDVVAKSASFGSSLKFGVDGAAASYQPAEGDKAIDLIGTPNEGALNQIIETTPGSVYTVRFSVSSNQENEVDVNGRLKRHSDRQLEFWWNGQLIQLIQAPDMGQWTEYTFQLTATSNLTQFGFAGRNTVNSQATEDGVIPVWGIPVKAGDPIFGPLVDKISVVTKLDAIDDGVTTLSEDFGFSSYNRDVMSNDIGGKQIVSAQIESRATNLPGGFPASLQGSIIVVNNPANGYVFWDSPGPDPMSLNWNFLSAGEYAQENIRYVLRSEAGFASAAPVIPAYPNGAQDAAYWSVRIVGANDSVNGLQVAVDDDTILEDQDARLTVSFQDPDLNDQHTATINWGDGQISQVSLAVGQRSFNVSHRYLDDNPTGTPLDVYPVSVTVRDAGGTSLTAKTQVSVQNVAPELFDVQLDRSEIQAGDRVTLSGRFVDPGTLDVHHATIDWGDGTADTVIFLVGGRNWSIDHVYDVDVASDVSLPILVTLADDDTGTDTATLSVLVHNRGNPPDVDAGDPQLVDEGDSVQFAGTIVDLDETVVSIAWDFGDGSPPVINELTPVHVYADNNVYTATLTVLWGDGQSIQDTVEIDVRNVAPAIDSLEVTASVSACESPTNGVVATLQASFVDPGFDHDVADDSLDTREDFTVTVDWGDGTVQTLDGTQWSEIAGSPGSPTRGTVHATHSYASDGQFLVTLTVVDDDDGSDAASATLTTMRIGIVDGRLLIIGTDERDVISVNKTGNGIVRVHADFLESGSFIDFPASEISTISVYACGGDDQVSVAGNMTQRVFADLGAGNDHMSAGGGRTVMLGNTGDDMLVGGTSHDILIGGVGADRLVGGRGEDILIAGRTSYDATESALLALLDDWNGPGNFATRVSRLRNGTGASGLRLAKGSTVFDDLNADQLTGSQDQDWFLLELARDQATDRKSNEAVN